MFAERKLQPHEHPHTLYIQNYSTASATCLAIRRWLFNVNRPLNEQALTWVFWQTIDEVNRGHITAGERLYQLKALQDASRKHEVRTEGNRLQIVDRPYRLREISCFFFLVVSEISEGTQRVRRHRVSALRVRLEEGGPRNTGRGHGDLQVACRERGRYPGVASGRIPMEHYRSVGSGRGRDGVLLPIHTPRQSSAPLAQGLHPLREYSPIFSRLRHV